MTVRDYGWWVLWVGLCGCPSNSSSSAAPTEPVASIDGRTLYMRACMSCHGPRGNGGGARSAFDDVGDLTRSTLRADWTDEAFRRLVQEGQGLMPGFGQTLSEAEVDAVAAHVWTLTSTVR